MKKTLLTVALAAASVAAFAQGKVNVIGDTASPIVLGTRTMPQDASLVGQPIGNATALPSGVTLVAGLYGGTSSSSLFLYSFTTLNVTANPAGTIPAFHVVLNAGATPGAPGIPGIAAGTAIGSGTPWFQVRIWDGSAPTYDAALAANEYTGEGAVFQLNPGPSLAYTSTAPPGANTTWTDAPITVQLVPEPGTFALAGLGAAAMLIFRRRK
jgi:hypothetical protein